MDDITEILNQSAALVQFIRQGTVHLERFSQDLSVLAKRVQTISCYEHLTFCAKTWREMQATNAVTQESLQKWRQKADIFKQKLQQQKQSVTKLTLQCEAIKTRIRQLDNLLLQITEQLQLLQQQDSELAIVHQDIVNKRLELQPNFVRGTELQLVVDDNKG